MDDTGYCVSKIVKQLIQHDFNLEWIFLYNNQYSDSELAELADCLLAHPDVVTHVYLDINHLTDETGVKLAQYVAASSTIQLLNLSNNQFGLETYLALAAALRVNSSLRELHLSNNQPVDRTRIEAAFVDVLRLNPDCPAESVWNLFSSSYSDLDFRRLKHAADALGHPTLQMILNHDLEKNEIKPVKRVL